MNQAKYQLLKTGSIVLYVEIGGMKIALHTLIFDLSNVITVGQNNLILCYCNLTSLYYLCAILATLVRNVTRTGR